ncbi:DNA internalization-related competence protein ComEC/Rec2 [Aciduricibacillus chroicocephali]|uniref:DNA internalization-related competence protein ComEC/Rec2 n=1 Tax=Aciduricibacillus chroicocephali TaxID=3054939 RepID=A0ABY9KRT9_9BACI|nr:DNA internalization-related competence protein ComEC/Rec2 [Bacillaceae bacterium 44XB]
MKGFWHYGALGVTALIFAKMLGNLLFVAAFVLWLAGLFIMRRIPALPFFLANTLLIVFYVMLPEQVNDVLPFSEKGRLGQQAGIISSSVEIENRKLSFSFTPDGRRDEVLALYFLKEDESINKGMLQHGAYCLFAGSLETPDPATNPGEFDFAKHLHRAGFKQQLIITDLEKAKCSGKSKWASIFDLRNELLEVSSSRLSSYTSSWHKALVLGDDKALPDEVIELFQRWSLSHLLAISGLHVGLIVTMIYFLVVNLGLLTKEKAQWALIIMLPAYAFIAGGQPSVWRASLMTALVILLFKIKLSLKTSDIISIVFLTLLLFSPSMITNVGFQLSFLVSFGIILSQRWLSRSESLFVAMLRLGFVSQMMILPLQIAYFQQLQPLSIILNMIIVPYFSFFVIPVMFILFLLLLLPLSEMPIIILSSCFEKIHPQVMKFVTFIDQYADFPILPGESFLRLSPLYVFTFILFMHFLLEERKNKAFIAGIASVAVLLAPALIPYFSNEGRVTMLDIGQGDAFVIEQPYRKGVIIIDAGASFSYETMEPNRNVYRRIISPFFKSRGIQHIDAVFISHEDLDHDGSLPFILEELSVGKVIASPLYEPALFIQKAIQKSGANLQYLAAGEVKKIGDIEFHALSPLEKTESANENSLVLFVEIGNRSWLFTGDIGHPAERKLIESYPGINANILKAGHHGSKNSTDEQFIKQLNPEYALISAGRGNRYGHPAPEVLEILQRNNVKVFRTDQSGAVIYRYKDGHSGTFLPFRP